MPSNQRNYAVIGLGRFGTTIALELTRLGDRVIGIDTSEALVSALADKIAHGIVADARDDEALREAGVAECDVAVVAIGENLEANIVAAMNLKLIGVPVIWAKAQSRTHHRILARIGVDRVVQPEHDTGIHVAHTLHSPFLRDYMPLGTGYSAVNIDVPEKFEGQPFSALGTIGLKEVYWMGLARGQSFSPAHELDTEHFLRRGDKLLFVGLPEALRRLAARL